MTTMLDKCAVAGDITQAIDRRGAWTVAITVIGGTESTAVKLQSCETASGSFTDFKTLIASADASAEQYKGFVVDLHGAKQFIKVTGATMATAVLGDCDHDLKSVAIKAGEVPSGADLDNNVEETINVSTYTEPVEVLPTEGKDGMKKATVALSNVPQIQSNKAQTIDVSQYTEPVEIEPTSPNDAMAKTTITLSNIPSGSGYLYQESDASFILGVSAFSGISVGTKGYACSAISEVLVEVTCTSVTEESATFETEDSSTFSLLAETVGTPLSFE